MLNIINKFLKHLISLGFAAVFLGVALLFIYVFTGVFAEGGSLVRVGVIDTGLDLKDPRFSKVLCSSGHKDLTGEGITDRHGHGTHIAGLIMKYAGNSGYCLVIIKYYSSKAAGPLNGKRFIEAIEASSNLNFVNISGGGSEFNEGEYLAIKNAPNTRFIVAAGNGGKSLDLPQYYYYPASYRLSNITVVGALSFNGTDRYEVSNFGSIVKAWEVGENVVSLRAGGGLLINSGTSMATAIHTGKLVSEALK